MAFSGIRTAIDILKNRLPGALAMLRAKDIAISVHHRENNHWCTVSFFFGNDTKSCGDAYRRIERLYEMERDQEAWQTGICPSPQPQREER